MGKHQKRDKKQLATRPDIITAMQHIAETEANLELLSAEKKALKANLRAAKKQLKKLWKEKPEKVKTDKKPKAAAPIKAKATRDEKRNAKTTTAPKAAGKKPAKS